MKPCILVGKVSGSSCTIKWWSNFGFYKTRAPRKVLEDKLGRPLRPGYECCHKCDTPNCVEPEHLWEGTRKENIQDASKKKRLVNNWKHSRGNYGRRKV